MVRGLQRLGGNGGRTLIDGLWFGAGFVLLVGLLLRVAAGFLSHFPLRLIGIAALALGVLLAVLAWAAEKVLHDNGPH